MPTFTVENDDQQTVLAAMRRHLPDKPSWSVVRRMMRNRRVAIGGILCLDESRRLSRGETVTVSDQSHPPPPGDGDVNVCFIDKQIVVVEKPAGMLTLRRKSEYAWPWTKRNLQPTLDECVPRLIGQHAARRTNSDRVHRKQPRLYPVHRLDRESSGLLVFARDEDSQSTIIQQFAQHFAIRIYLALIPGAIKDQTVKSHLIRDRGDGLRGSASDASIGQQAITHIKTLRRFDQYSEITCRLETGRTNQIRIHLAELGHPICGDIKYRGPYGGTAVEDNSGIHRMALHASELRFKHPTTGQWLDYAAPWPLDMLRFIEELQ